MNKTRSYKYFTIYLNALEIIMLISIINRSQRKMHQTFTPPGGKHLCARINKMAYVTLNKFFSNWAHFLYVVSRHFLFIKYDSSGRSDQILTIASRTLSITNKCSCHFLYNHPQLLPPLLVRFLYICSPLPTTNRLAILVGQVERRTQMKKNGLYPGCHEVWSALAEFFQSINKGKIWCYNILGDNKGSISHILQHDNITPGSVLLAYNLVVLKKENPEPIFKVNRIEWENALIFLV